MGISRNEQFKAAYIFEYIYKKESTNNVEIYTLTLTNLGYCYLELGNPKALEYLKSLRIALKLIILVRFTPISLYQSTIKKDLA
jgi:hypothetical protein